MWSRYWFRWGLERQRLRKYEGLVCKHKNASKQYTVDTGGERNVIPTPLCGKKKSTKDCQSYK